MVDAEVGTHGTSEFGQIRERMIEYLVTHEGFDVVALEANGARCEDINRYLRTGEGDPVALVEGLKVWIWRTNEMLDLVRWMRAYNASGQGHVRFAGFDIQVPDREVEEVIGWVRVHAPEHAAAVTAALGSPGVAPLDDPEVGDTPATVSEWMTASAPEWRSRFPDEPVDHVVHSAWIIAQHAAMSARRSHAAQVAIRNRAMAENVEWIADEAGPDARVLLWGHNGHMSREPGEMGDYLTARYGAEYVAVGTTTASGAFRAISLDPPGFGEHPIPEPPIRSVEAALHAQGYPCVFLDVQRGLGEHVGWLRRVMPMLDIGAIVSGRSYLRRPLSWFDGIVFVDETTPTRDPAGVSE